MLVKTTLRLKENLKKSAERKALEGDTTLQEVINSALENYLEKESRKPQLSLGFADWVDKYIKENRTALEELAKR